MDEKEEYWNCTFGRWLGLILGAYIKQLSYRSYHDTLGLRILSFLLVGLCIFTKIYWPKVSSNDGSSMAPELFDVKKVNLWVSRVIPCVLSSSVLFRASPSRC